MCDNPNCCQNFTDNSSEKFRVPEPKWVKTPEARVIELLKLDRVLGKVREEVMEATLKFSSFNSAHEGYAVILEEVDELWDEVKANRGDEQSALDEAKQVAAMGVRYLMDLG